MIINVMCRIADGQLSPGELEITQPVAPLVSWTVNTLDASGAWDPLAGDLVVELHLPGDTVWTGEAYPVAGVEPEHQVPGGPPAQKVQLRGTGPLRENSIPLHADVVIQRIERAMLIEPQC